MKMKANSSLHLKEQSFYYMPDKYHLLRAYNVPSTKGLLYLI